MAAPAVELSALANEANRSAWISRALAQVKRGFYDGIVFDYESPQEKGSAEASTYADLVSETREAFHAENPSYQISTCVAWSPDDIDGRAYPYVELAQGSDLLYVMDYDTRSQIFDQCLASANAPFPGMIKVCRGTWTWGSLLTNSFSGCRGTGTTTRA